MEISLFHYAIMYAIAPVELVLNSFARCQKHTSQLVPLLDPPLQRIFQAYELEMKIDWITYRFSD